MRISWPKGPELAGPFVNSYPSEPLHNWKRSGLGERLPMTIGVGFRYVDGIILGADSQLTYGDRFKTVTGSKIAHSAVEGTGYTLAMAGAGHMEFLENFYEQIVSAIDGSDKTSRKAKELISSSLHDLYLNHIFPYNTHRSGNGDIAMLIAFKGTEKDFGFWKTSSTAVIDAEQCDFIGSGSYSATFFANSLYRPNLTREEAVIAAAGILERVKKFDPYCSGNSQIYAIRSDGKLSRELVKPIGRIEQYWEDSSDAAMDVIVKCGNPKLSEGDVDEAIRSFGEKLKEFRKKIESPLTRALRNFFSGAPLP
jgi:20S proteasome alpha/beta subunit